MVKSILIGYDLLLSWVVDPALESFTDHLFRIVQSSGGTLTAKVTPETLARIFRELTHELSLSSENLVAAHSNKARLLRQVLDVAADRSIESDGQEANDLLAADELIAIEIRYANHHAIPIVCFNVEKYRALAQSASLSIDIWNVVDLRRTHETYLKLSNLVHSNPALFQELSGLEKQANEETLPVIDALDAEYVYFSDATDAVEVAHNPQISTVHSQDQGPSNTDSTAIGINRGQNVPSIRNDDDSLGVALGLESSQNSEQKKQMNEVKILLVGQGNVGKTSLIKRLIDKTFDPNESKTEGINIRKWPVSIKDLEIRLNVWDFGGQEIMHSTHQFFLTRKSIYLLVLDTRSGQEENRVEYWLKIIQSFGGIDAPIIIVGNKADQHPLDIDRQGLRKKYPNIKGFLETSCRDDSGIADLEQVIKQEVCKLEHIYEPLPVEWFAVKNYLERLEYDYIPYSEYEKLCLEKAITHELSQQNLLATLHVLGVVLNFQDHPRLQDTNVLKPEWVTNGVYKILNDRDLILEHKGILKWQELARILPPQRYPPKTHSFILDLMRKFELCFDIEPDQEFLIPDLLPREEPDTGDWQNALAFEYHYSVLPSSIITRFIVRMRDKISKRTYWRNGVLLAYEGNKALVKADQEEKKIFIWITGNPKSRRSLLSTIRFQFDSIHRTFRTNPLEPNSALEFKQKVPIPNHPDVEPVDYEHLLNLEKKGVISFIPPGFDDWIEVRQLLEGVEEPEQIQQRLNPVRFAEQELITLNIYNSNVQENQSMSNINQPNINQYGLGDNIAGDKVAGDKILGDKVAGDKIGTQINNSPNLVQAAQDIKDLLDQLTQSYPSNPVMVGAKAIEEIDRNPTLKVRIINALKEAGTTALEKLVDHPSVGIVIAGAKGFMNP